MNLHLAAALVLAASPLSSAAPEWSWKVDQARSIELHGAAGPIVRFLVDPSPADPHFDLLATPDGRNLVWVGPPDHVWHYGLWFSWKYINGVNFWETDKNTGASPGRTEVLEPSITPEETEATVRYRRLYRLPDQEAPIMEDKVVVTIRKPNGKLGPAVDWFFTTTALADLKLDRTPPPDEPGGASWGGYGGLSWRGAKDLEDLRFLDSTGRTGLDMHRKHANWVNASGTLSGKPAGLAILDHPENPGHPTSWYVLGNKLKHGPFWFINPALVQPKPIEMKKGEHFTHRYRLLVHDGSLDATALDKELKAFPSRTGEPHP